MVAKFLDHNNRELKQRQRRRQRERQKSYMINKQNNNFARASRYSVNFDAVPPQLRRKMSD